MSCQFCNNSSSVGCAYCSFSYIQPYQPGQQMQYVKPVLSKGWECPKCEAVMNPAMMMCMNCTGSKEEK